MCMLIASILCGAKLHKLADPVLATRFDTPKFFIYGFITWLLPISLITRQPWATEALPELSWESAPELYKYFIFPICYALGTWLPWAASTFTLYDQHIDEELLKTYVPRPERKYIDANGRETIEPASKVPLARPRSCVEKIVILLSLCAAYGLGIFWPWLFHNWFPVPYNMITLALPTAVFLSLCLMPFSPDPDLFFDQFVRELFPRMGMMYVLFWFGQIGAALVLADGGPIAYNAGWRNTAMWFIGPVLIVLKHYAARFNTRVLPASRLTVPSFCSLHATSAFILALIYSLPNFPLEVYAWTLSLQLVEVIVYFVWLCNATPQQVKAEHQMLSAYLIMCATQVGAPLMVLVFVILAVKGPNSDFFTRVHLQDPDQLEQVTVRLLWAAFAHLALVVPVLVLPSISWGQLLTINRKMAIQCLVHSLYMVFPSIFVFSLYGGCVQCQGLDRYQ